MGYRIMHGTRLGLMPWVAVACVALVIPGRAADVDNFGDTTTAPFPANSLRGVIRDINDPAVGANGGNEGTIRFIMGGVNRNIGLAATMTTIGRDTRIEIWDNAVNQYEPANGPLTLTISGSNSRGALIADGTMNVNIDSRHILRFSGCSPAIRQTTGGGATVRRVEITGGGTDGIDITTNSNSTVTVESAIIAGDRGGDGIAVGGGNNAVQIRGVVITDQSGDGISLNNTRSVTIESLAPQVRAGGLLFPHIRFHNFIGFRGQFTTGIDAGFDQNLDGNCYGVAGDINGVGIDITDAGATNITIQDTDVGECDQGGIRIDPDNTVSNIFLRRLHVGVVPEAARVLNPGITLLRVNGGDSIRILGGRAEVDIGNANDFNPNNNADITDRDLNFSNDPPTGTYAWEHLPGDLGITASGARNNFGMRVGLGDDPINGVVNINGGRFGPDSVGLREVVDAILDAGAPRRQDTGLYCNVNGGPLTVQDCQMVGNTNRGCFLQGSARLNFVDNNVGLDATTQKTLYSSTDSLGANNGLAIGNGTRSFHEGTLFPAGVTGGEGLRVDTSGLILTFNGNVVAGNATDGVIITNNCPGTAAPPIASGAVGDGTDARWNHIGTQGRGQEAGRDVYAAAVINPDRGRKLIDASHPDTADTQTSSDNATGWFATSTEFLTPRIRGNGTTVFSSGAGAANQAFGSGFTYQGTGPLVVRGITVSDNAVDGFVIDTPQNNTGASVQLTRARIGVDDSVGGVTAIVDQSIGNGTICRGATSPAYASISRRQGAGIRINGDGQNQIGVGSDTANMVGLDIADRNVISSNLVWGIQLTGNVGTTDPLATSVGIAACRIGTNLAGDSAGTVSQAQGSLGFGNGHIMADPTMGLGPAYPGWFGAGIRVEPNAKGRHLIGGDDGATNGDALTLTLDDSTTISERNVIANNGLAGVWLLGEGSVAVAGNYIGVNAAGTAVPTGHDALSQYHGVLIEQAEFSLHRSASGGGNSANQMQPQYVGQIPFSSLTNLNPNPASQGGGPGYYGNVIVNAGIWGVAVEDDGEHVVAGNHIGVNAVGDAAIGNGVNGGLPLTLSITLHPQSFLRTGGVEIGALNQLISSGKVVIGGDTAAQMNVVSGNTGEGIVQYRSGIAEIAGNFIGTNRAGTAALPNSLHGVHLYGDGNNEIRRSLISGNTLNGIQITGSGNNKVTGNAIGTNAGLAAGIANGQNGIRIGGTATGSNTIGQEGSANGGARKNVISGNTLSGIRIDGPGDNLVRSNFIGLVGAGNAALANGGSDTANDREGILITGAGSQTIGGTTLGPDPGGGVERVNIDGNVISGNRGNGVLILNTASGNNTVVGNLIGLNGDPTTVPAAATHGTSAVGNTLNGIDIGATSGANLIQDNVVSGNALHGVLVESTGSTTLTGNRAGTNRQGLAAVGNGQNGISVTGTGLQFIGLANTTDTALDDGNLVSGNNGQGIFISSAGAHEVYGNFLGTDKTGTVAIPNAGSGLHSAIPSGNGSPIIGGTLTGQFNLISGNTGVGLALTSTADHLVRGNRIGIDLGGTSALGNGGGTLAGGLSITGTGTNTISENRVSGNRGPGVTIAAGNNTLRLNRIGTNRNGDGLLTYPGSQPAGQRQTNGVLVSAPTGTTQIIGVATEGNVISGNDGHGVEVTGQANVTFVSNLIGLNVAGTVDLGNGQGGVGHGIDVAAGSGGTIAIGGTGTNEQNTISGNSGQGINHEGNTAPSIVHNRIGTNANTSAAIANDTGGVRFASTNAAVGTLILGGNATNQGNVISGNGGVGVTIAAACGHPVQILGNMIGTNSAGSVALGNASHGVLIETGNSINQTIGGATSGDRNVISGNGTGGMTGHGVYARGTGTSLIENNSIGGDLLGGSLAGNAGNSGDGVLIETNANGNTLRNNIIRDNAGRGVAVANTASRQQITGNQFINNGVTNAGGVITVNKLPLDLGANDAVGGSGGANANLAAPTLLRLVPASGGQGILSGTVAAGTSRVEIYQANDPLPNDVDANLAALKHHGGATGLLTTVTTPATSFNATVTVSAGQLVTALAFDANGNTSEFSRNIGLVDSTTSTLAAAPSTLIADGTTTSTVTATLRDQIGTPMVGVADVALGFNPAFTGLVTPASPLPATDGNGATQATVRSTQAGFTDVTASTGGLTIPPTGQTPPRITFVPANLNAGNSSFVADKTQARSDGSEMVTFTFTVRDGNNLPIQGFDATQLKIFPNPTNGVTIVAPAGVTDANGQATGTATGNVEQLVTFTGRLGDATGPVIPNPVQVNFVAVPIDATGSTVTVIGSPVANDNTSTANIRIAVRNVNGQPVTGIAGADIVASANAGAQNVTFGTPAEDAATPGTYNVTVRSSTIQTITVTVSVRGVVLNQTGQVQFIAGAPTGTQSSLTVTPTTAIADGVQVVGATVVVQDNQGQPVANVPVALVVTPNTGVNLVQPELTNASGQASGSFTATVAGSYQVSAVVGPPPGNFTLGPQTVTMTANPPDPAASSVAVSPTAIVADATQTALITVTLVDGQGRLMAGVQPNEFVFEALPATGITITPPTSASNSDGQVTASIRGNQAGVVTIRVRARGQLLNSQPQLTLQSFVSQHFEIGTHLMAIPAEPIDPAPGTIFADLLPGLRLARWSPTGAQYATFVQGTTEPLLQVHPGRGFWLQLNRIFDLRVVGTQTPDGPFDIATAQGWNQLGNPYTGRLDFRLNQIQVLQNGVSVGTLDTAAARALVDPYAWKWDPVLGYLLVLDPATSGAATIPGDFGMGTGFWMLVRQPNVTLRFNGPTRAASGRATRSKAASPAEWLVSLQASAAGTVTQANVLGVGDGRLAAALPPDGPSAPLVRLTFKDESGRAVATDVRSGPITSRARWTALVDAPADSDVTLAWPGINRGIPENHRLWLTDPTNGRRLLMNSRASYAYRQGEGTREFVIEVDPRGERTLNLNGLQVRSGRSRAAGIPIEFSLTAPATVHVQVKGLRGTVIRSLSDQVDEGTNTVVWDGLDDQGRRVPAGVYQIELTATTDEGEVVRATRQARID